MLTIRICSPGRLQAFQQLLQPALECSIFHFQLSMICSASMLPESELRNCVLQPLLLFEMLMLMGLVLLCLPNYAQMELIVLCGQTLCVFG